MSSHTWPIEEIKNYFVTEHNKWDWRHISGTLFLMAGVLALLFLWGKPNSAVVLYYALLLVVCSVLQFLRSLHLHQVKQKAWHVILAVFLFVVGASLISEPELTAQTFKWVIVLSLMVLGGSSIYLALKQRSALKQERSNPGQENQGHESAEPMHYHWSARLLAGLVAFFTAGLIFASWPQSLVWAAGIYVAVEMFVASFHRISHRISHR